MPIIADSSQGTTQPIVPIPTKTTTVPTNTVQAIPEASNAINTNQFNFGANIGKIPGVNDKTMAQNPIFQTKEFKEKESLTIEGIKDPIFGESIKNIKSGPYSIDEQVRLIGLAKLQKSKRDSAMSLVGLVGDLLNPSEPIPDDQVDAVYSDLTPEVRNAARGFAADMLNGMPLDEGRKLYPELGKSFFFNKVQDIPYVNQINLDNIKQDISNRTPSDMIPFVEPTFQGNAKDLGRTGFLGGFQEVAKFVGNIPSTILNAAIFGTNFMINPESTGKRVGLLPKSLDLSIRQARADTEGLSMPYRMQHLVNNVADFVTENPDIVVGFELGGLIEKGATRGIGTFMDSIKPIKDVIIDELKAEGISEPTVSQFEAKAQEIYDRQFKKNAETSVDVNVEDGITYTNNRGEVVPAPIINTSQKINDMVFQSLSPTQRGARVKNVRDIQKFAEKMTKGISAVFLNRDNLPDLFESGMLKKDYSMVDLGQAIEDTGDDVWDTAQGMLDEAELQGTKIPTNLIVNYIDQSIADLTRNGGKVIPGFEGVIKYLNDLKNYVGGDDISIYDAQILSKKLNKLTYGGSQSDNLNKRVAEDVNQILRPSIDNELSNMLGQKGLSNFKAIFGAVRELNELVTKLALKDAKQLPMSFWDRVSQGFTANEMMNAGFSIARGDFVGATMSASKAFMAKVVSNFVKADKDRGLILRKLFNEINSQVGDVKIAGGYGTHLVRKMGAVEEMIRGAKKDKSVKLDYTPEATPMITPEGTIKQTIVTTPEAKGGTMQTDITKPGAIKEPGKNQYSEFLVGYAPFREGNISDVTTIDLAKQSKQYNNWIMKANNFAKTLGLDISTDNKTIGVRGKTSDSRELSRFTIVKGDKNDIKTFAAMMGATAPDIQNAVMMGEYTKGVKANGVELSFTINGDVNAVIDSLQEQGIQNLTYIPETKQVVLIDTDNTFTEAQTDFIHSLYKNGDTADLRKQGVNTNFIGEDEYVGILGEALNTNRGQQNMTNVRDALEFAEAKARRGGGGYSKKLAEKRKASLDKVKSYISTNKEKLGLSDYTETHVASLDENISKKISKAFDKAIDYNDPNATPAYKADVKKAYTSLANETSKQYDFLTKKLGLKIEFIKDDPYKTSDDMFEDILENNRLKIYQGGEPNEFMSQVDKSGLSINEKFRAIHDFFGHFIEGNHFGKLGEEKAWVSHSKMFSPEARKALTTETRGQNSWVNFSGKNKNALKKFAEARDLIEQGKISEGLQLQKEGQSEFIYADQKTSILPDKYVDYTHYNKIEEANKTSNIQGLKKKISKKATNMSKTQHITRGERLSAEEFVNSKVVNAKNTPSFGEEVKKELGYNAEDILSKSYEVKKKPPSWAFGRSFGKGAFTDASKIESLKGADFSKVPPVIINSDTKSIVGGYHRLISASEQGKDGILRYIDIAKPANESQLKQIREEENQSRRKDLPTRKDAVRAKNQENMDKYGTNNPEPIDILTYDKNILQKQFNNLINAGDTVSAGKILPELTELIDKVNEIVKAKARQKILDRKKTNPNLPSPPNQ